MADGGKSEEYRGLNGVQRAAVLMLALGEDQCARLFGMMHEDELKDILRRDGAARLGTRRGRGAAVRRFHRKHRQRRQPGRQFREHRASAAKGPAARSRRADHGGNPWSSRADDVGQARQRQRERAGELPEERISANRRRRPVQGAAGSRGARAVAAAGFLRHGSGDAHAAHGKRAEGCAGRRGKNPARRIHVQPRPQHQARRARDDG